MYITKNLYQFLKGKKASILKIASMQILDNIVRIIYYLNFAFIIKSIITKDVKIFTYSVISLTIFFLISSFVKFLSEKIQSEHFSKIRIMVRSELLEKILFLGPKFTEKKQGGNLISTVWNKVEWFTSYYTDYLPTCLSSFAITILLTITLSYFNSLVAISYLICSILILTIPFIFYNITEKSGKKEWLAETNFLSICMDGIKGISTLKAFNANFEHKEKVKRCSTELRKSIMSNLIYTTANTKALEFAILLVTYLPFIVVCLVLKDFMQIIIVYFLLQAVKEFSSNIMRAWLQANKGLTSLDSIFEVYNAKNTSAFVDVKEKSNTILSGDITFDNISFAYDKNGKETLSNISFKIKENTTTAFVGNSGSGKTTVARLLFGFYKADEGKISIGSTELNSNTLQDFQTKIACVWQDNHIFLDSCIDNIKIAKPSATDEEVYVAAKNANIHDFILSLPNGYNTIIGDGARGLSGGEKQRFAIARAFLKNADILILDEATSSLDRNNEVEISESINKLSKGKTVLVIAHRLETIEKSDQICVFKDGKIVEKGNHVQLVANSSFYNQLVKSSSNKEAVCANILNL